MPTLSEIAQAFLIVFMLSMHVIGFGLLLVRAAKFTHHDLWIVSAAVGGAGASAAGFEMWLLGYVNGWNQLTFCISSLVLLLVVIAFARHSRHTMLSSLRVFRSKPEGVTEFLPMIALVTMCIATFSCLRPPLNGDEVAYHWPAPMLWATTHHWIESPFRFTNGPSFIELLYVPSALFQNITAGHFAHLVLWMILLTSCCALGRLLLSPPLPTIVAVMACPMATSQASQMASDIGATSYLVSALAILFSLRSSRFMHRHILLSAFVFCGCLSSKQPFALGVMPVVVMFLLFGLTAPNLRARITRVFLFLLPCLLTEIGWLIHTHWLTGKLFDVPVDSIWTNSYQPHVPGQPHGALGLAGPPSSEKLLLLAVAPFITWLVGNQEPFGGRTGLTVAIFLPVFIIALRHYQQPQKRLGYWILGTSVFYYISVGIFVIRTRYHMIVWVLWSTLAAAGFTHARGLLSGQKRWCLVATFYLAVTLGCIDSCRSLSVWKGNTPHILPQIPWLLK